MHPHIQATLNQGLRQLQAGRPAQAEQLFRQALSLDKHNVNALHLLGVLLSQTRCLAEGEACLRKAVKLNKNHAPLQFNLGNNLDAQGKVKESIVPFRMAVQLDGNNEWHHSGLGLAYLKLERYDEAIATLLQGLKRNPNNTTLLTNLGNALWRRGDKEQGIERLERAIELDPDLVEANAVLGGLYFEKGEVTKAETVLRRALAVNPNHYDAINNLAGVLLHQLQKGDLKDTREAVALCRQLVAITPQFAEAHLKLGRALEKAEQHQEAAQVYATVLAQRPKDVEAIQRLAHIHMILGNLDEADRYHHQSIELLPDQEAGYNGIISAGRSLLSAAETRSIEALLTKRQQQGESSPLFFGYARYLEKQRQYEQAFHYLAIGNQLKRTTFEYSTADSQARFDNIAATYNAEFFQARQGYGLDDGTMILIVGLPRCGSTLTEQILSSHPAVFGAGELPTFSRVLSERIVKSDQALELSNEQWQEIGAAYLQEARERSDGRPRITDKGLGNFQNLGALYCALPRARIIHCQRHPVDNCYAIYKQDFASLHPYAYDLEELGQYYLFYQDLMAHWRQVLPKGHIFDCRYEDMVNDQEGTTRALLEFCGLDWDDRCLNFHQSKRAVQTASISQVRQKIYKDSVALWRRYEQQLAPLIEKLGAPIPLPSPLAGDDSKEGGGRATQGAKAEG